MNKSNSNKIYIILFTTIFLIMPVVAFADFNVSNGAIALKDVLFNSRIIELIFISALCAGAILGVNLFKSERNAWRIAKKIVGACIGAGIGGITICMIGFIVNFILDKLI